MACLISMTFSIPLSISHSFANDVALQKSALVRFSSQPTSDLLTAYTMAEASLHGTTAVAKPSAFRNTKGAVSSLNWRCRHLTTPLKPVFEITYCHMNVKSCSHTIISGYWVGPDIDDGWGYVEAFVNQIT